MKKFELYSKELEEVLKKLNDLQRRNQALLTKYNGDAKFVRIHKRIKEENRIRRENNKKAIISEYDTELFDILKEVKEEIDQKVYDRNNILKQDAFFEQTVMSLISNAIDKKSIETTRDDRIFIQRRITKQYLDQYKETYSIVA